VTVNLQSIFLSQTTSIDRNYTVNHKKRDILFFIITLADLNRFSQFFYHFNREEILHVTIIKFSTSPDLCAHLTWKNQNLHFCRGS